MQITVRVNLPPLPPASPAASGALERALADALLEAEVMITNEAKRRAPVKTGALRRSIGFEPPTVANGRVVGTIYAGGPSAPYAAAIDSGSGLYGPSRARYPIRPTRVGGVLAWKGADGRPRFARRVMHPGVKPTYFLTGAAVDLEAKVLDVLQAKIAAAFGMDGA